ncbi:hypothetical protein [Rhodoferax saidenbachensis]|nr:hypothetical protein [Rhodoferax saidenbachensis]
MPKPVTGVPPYINPIPDLSPFAMVSAMSIIDPVISYPQRLVLSILALHAKRHGQTAPPQDRIAALAGWYCKNKETGEMEPNARYVSTLINNENHTKKSDRCGPGLVQLGYVKPGYKQNGFNQPNTYQLTTPTFSEGYICRPDGTKTESRFVASVEREDTKTYKARKSAEQTAYELQQIAPKKKFSAEDQLPLDLSDTYNWMGDEYTRRDCEVDIQNCRDGLEQDVPDAVYRYFQMAVPADLATDY